MTPATSDLEPLLSAAVEYNASDLILQENKLPFFRVNGAIVAAEGDPVSEALMDSLWKSCNADPDDLDADAALTSQEGHRFRVNLLRQMGSRSAVLRRISSEVPAFAELGLPAELLQQWVDRKSGLILICGPTGSGKSTTVAAMVDWINQESAKHIITVEDPVEYLFTPARSVITQREIGLDTHSFSEGMRRALRQSPDVIFVGEIRDRETAEIALQASETGHVVLSTLHVGRAVEAVTRLGLLFPASERDAVATILSRELVGVLCQRLIATVEGKATVALEYFTNAGAVSKLLAENKSEELADLVANPRTQDTRSLTQDLIAKLKAGLISEETARHASPEPMEISRALRGIK